MLHSLQACRAAAAALVVLFHLGGTFAQDRYFGFKTLDGPFAWGDAGVDFFFVLSGFLIASAHWRDIGQPSALRPYLLKRLIRIYPSYWVVCLAVLLAALVVPSLRAALPADAATFFKALLLVPQDPAKVGGTGSPILFVAWSLQYEMLFYAVMAAFIAHRGLGMLAVAALLTVDLSCQWANGCSFPWSFVHSPMLYLFAMGVAGALFVRSDLRLLWPLQWAVLAGLGLIALAALEGWLGREALPIDRRWLYGALALMAIVGLARAEMTEVLRLSRRWPDLLGDASYALYLVHIPIISVLVKLIAWMKVSQPAALVLAFGLVFLTCVIAALAFHRWIERPMLDRFRSAVSRSRARAPQPAREPSTVGLQ